MRSFLALPCGDCEPFLEARKWKCFVWVYASGVLCQDVWLFRLLRDRHCEDYKSACLRSVLLLDSPAMTKHRCSGEKKKKLYSSFHLMYAGTYYMHAHAVNTCLCVCAHVSVGENMSQIERWGLRRTEKQTPLMKQTGGTKAERSEKKR